MILYYLEKREPEFTARVTNSQGVTEERKGTQYIIKVEGISDKLILFFADGKEPDKEALDALVEGAVGRRGNV
jgi:hypothetical protein